MHTSLYMKTCRSWQYNSDVTEFYVIYEDKSATKKAETTRELEETQLAATWTLFWNAGITHI